MKELKCPKCGNIFSVDEADYAFIVSQVRNEEFDAELNRRIQELHKQHIAEQQLEKSKQDKVLADNELEHQQELSKKEQDYQAELNRKEQDHLAALSKKEDELQSKDLEIEHLRTELNNKETLIKAEMEKEIAKKDNTITELQGRLEQSNGQKDLAVQEVRSKAMNALAQKDIEIANLKGEVKEKEKDTANQLTIQKEKYEGELQKMKEMVEYYKDMKVRLSTKMVGESLEVYCSTEFNKMRSLFPNAYFEKDNEACGEENSKGDFIFRDYEDGIEYISIMFEMKNENDETATKHTNESFLKRLDTNRNNKNCEYAVLVSLLERDSELYNTGIVDVSYLYPKMYVIRPQFFMQFISILMQAAKKSVAYRKELAIVRSQSIDVNTFEQQLDDFREDFGRNVRLASDKFQSAVKEIDDSIARLEKIKKYLLGSDKNLQIADKKAQKLTIKKLTKDNPTMKALFDEARKRNESKVQENPDADEEDLDMYEDLTDEKNS